MEDEGCNGHQRINKKPRIDEILSDINVEVEDAIELLHEELKFADLGLSNVQSLLVQLPGTSRISTIAGRVLIQV